MIDAVFWWAWLGAARVTRMLPADDIFVPVHEWVERRWRSGAARMNDPGLTEKQQRAGGRAVIRWQWVAALITCFYCWGLWVYLAMTGVAALASLDTTSWHVLGGPWWWTLPCSALGVQYVMVTVMSWTDPAVWHKPKR